MNVFLYRQPSMQIFPVSLSFHSVEKLQLCTSQRVAQGATYREAKWLSCDDSAEGNPHHHPPPPPPRILSFRPRISATRVLLTLQDQANFKKGGVSTVTVSDGNC